VYAQCAFPARHISFDEALSWNEPMGAVLVVAGIALGQGLLRRRSVPAGQPAAS
jgi:hypothetical protein